MNLRSGILCAVVSLAFVSSACSAAEEEESTEDALVSFPSAVFTTARTIAYGQTLQNLTFKASDKYLAVKFQGTKGDRIVGTVTPTGSTKSIVHLARKQGSTFVSVKAGGVDAASPNIVLHTIPTTGTYYLVFRTSPTTDGVFAAVNLERLAPAGGKCADAGKTPTVRRYASGRVVEDLETQPTHSPVILRTCHDTYATWSAIAGRPLAAVSQRMGHEDVNTTMAYFKEVEDRSTRTGTVFSSLAALYKSNRPGRSVDQLPGQIGSMCSEPLRREGDSNPWNPCGFI